MTRTIPERSSRGASQYNVCRSRRKTMLRPSFRPGLKKMRESYKQKVLRVTRRKILLRRTKKTVFNLSGPKTIIFIKP